jgi:xanthine dehydrogenase accessory factor
MNFLENAYFLEQNGLPFVVATVVRAEKPTSAKAGAKAVITADGQLQGWIGGSCAEPTVRREARKALQDGQPRLVRLCPAEKMGALPQDGVIEVVLTCVSGGTLEIYIEPNLSQPHLVVIGHLATTEALVRLGAALNFQVSVVGLDASRERFPQARTIVDRLDLSSLEISPAACIVVASHGNYDEDALEAALRTEAGYVALLASKTRAQALLQYLRRAGLAEERLARLKVPAGLDIGAVTPEEIALSILAEIVQLRRRGEAAGLGEIHQEAEALEAEEARDPVCGMMVEIATARFMSEYGGEMYYFCARSCQRSFEAEPEKYLIKT